MVAILVIIYVIAIQTMVLSMTNLIIKCYANHKTIMEVALAI